MISSKQRVATVVICRASINARRTQKLEDCGIEFRHRDVDPSRQASGEPVFGKDGISMCGLSGLWSALLDQGYVPTDVHLYQRPQDTNKSVLSVAFTLNGKSGQVSPRASTLCRELFEGTTWQYVHVWANPEREGGPLVDTVNVAVSKPEQPASCELELNDGQWLKRDR